MFPSNRADDAWRAIKSNEYLAISRTRTASYVSVANQRVPENGCSGMTS